MITRRTFLVSTAAGISAPWKWLAAQATPDLVILHTNDIHGHVDVEGASQGLVYVARQVRRARQEFPNTLSLDAGDIIHGTPMEQLHGPAPVIGAFNALGFDAATVGNHEFDFGPENLRHASRLAKFPLLSSNVRTAEGEPWGPLKPYVVIKRGGKRIGVFGLTTLETPTIEWPRTIESIRFTDPEEAARQSVKALREKENVDLVVALSHLGYKPDQKLAHEAPGIDLIIGGHSHTRLEKATYENGVPIVQTGCYGRALGQVQVWFGDVRPRFEYRLFDATDSPGADEGVMGVYSADEKRLDGELAEVLTTMSGVLSAENIGKEATPTGRFLAESVRAEHQTDIGLFHSSSYSKALGPGAVRRKDVFESMGAYTRQHVVRAEVSAALLRAEVERTMAGGEMPIQVAGYDANRSSKATVAGPAHVIQSMFLGKPEAKILYDDPLGPNVRDAVMAGLKKGLYEPFLKG